MNTVDKVIKIALAEDGYLEKSKSAYQADPNVLYDKTKGAGSDNYTKYGKEMHDIYPKVMDFPAYWCDCFVDWCFMKAYGVANAKGILAGDFDDYTKGSINLYKNKSAFFLRDMKTPQIGDQVFFTKDGTYSGVHHTALVYNVDDHYIYTIEGNTSSESKVIPNGGAVCKKSYLLESKSIYGYGRPRYESPELNGFVKQNNKWYYYENGVMLKNAWKLHNHHWYRLGSNGALLTGWQKITDKNHRQSWCYFEEKDEKILGAEWHERDDRAGYLEVWYV